MEENEGKDLAQERKEELLDKIRRLQNEKREERENENVDIKYYEDCELQLGKNKLKVSIAEINEKMLSENEETKEIITYDIYMKYKGEDILIANINEDGKLKINKEELEKIDPENKLGLLELGEDEKPDLSELKELDGKTEKELEQEKEDREKENEETSKDDNEEKNEYDEEEEELEDKEAEEEKEEIARRKNISSKNIFILRPDSQFYENYPQVPKTTYFYRDNDGKIKAEYIDKNGNTKPSEHFNDSTTNMREKVVGLGDNGEDIKEEEPYQVMTTKGLTNTNRNARDIRIAIYIENGYMEFEETRQGTNGKWTGYGLEGKGRDYNSHTVNELSNTKTNKVEPSDVSDRYDAVENTGLADDGVQLQDLSPIKTIERFMDEGYNKEESIDIYNYMIGEKQLSEEDAKEKVNEEIVEKIEKNEREIEEDNQKTPWGDAWNRRHR